MITYNSREIYKMYNPETTHIRNVYKRKWQIKHKSTTITPENDPFTNWNYLN